MEDQHKWRDKFELSLDNRQIFLFFAASAVVLSLVFALGVVVGKRMDPVVAAQPKQDPLAMLDQVGASDDSLTFAETLSSAAKPADNAPANDNKTIADKSASDQTTAPEDKPNASANAAKKTTQPAVTAKPLAAKKMSKADIARAKAEARKAQRLAKIIARQAERMAAKQANHMTRQAARANRVLQSAVAKAEAKAAKAAKVEAAKAKAKAAKAAKASKEQKDKPELRGYALQLSAFQNRHEAEQFMLKLRKQGYNPEMVRATIPNRGLWYRVRMGNYQSWKQAIEAKVQFERQQSTIAYVSRR
jgi:DedD protein